MGAGRPKGRNPYGESTKPIRIPQSRIEEVKKFLNHGTSTFELPLFTSTVRAGFPSPADDHIERRLDLNAHLIKHPSSTFFVKASGNSMENAGIQSGDMLIVDKSLEPTHGKIVIAAINGELTVKRLSLHQGKAQLLAAHSDYPPIDITPEQEMVIWGVVTHVIHEAK